jgi:hypothetical protein
MGASSSKSSGIPTREESYKYAVNHRLKENIVFRRKVDNELDYCRAKIRHAMSTGTNHVQLPKMDDFVFTAVVKDLESEFKERGFIAEVRYGDGVKSKEAPFMFWHLTDVERKLDKTEKSDKNEKEKDVESATDAQPPPYSSK